MTLTGPVDMTFQLPESEWGAESGYIRYIGVDDEMSDYAKY